MAKKKSSKKSKEGVILIAGSEYKCTHCKRLVLKAIDDIKKGDTFIIRPGMIRNTKPNVKAMNRSVMEEGQPIVCGSCGEFQSVYNGPKKSENWDIPVPTTCRRI